MADAKKPEAPKPLGDKPSGMKKVDWVNLKAKHDEDMRQYAIDLSEWEASEGKAKEEDEIQSAINGAFEDQSEIFFDKEATDALIVDKLPEKLQQIGALITVEAAGTWAAKSDASAITQRQWATYSRRFRLPSSLFMGRAKESGLTRMCGVLIVRRFDYIIQNYDKVCSMIGSVGGLDRFPFGFLMSHVKFTDDDGADAMLYGTYLLGHIGIVSQINQNLRESHAQGKMLDRTALTMNSSVMQQIFIGREIPDIDQTERRIMADKIVGEYRKFSSTTVFLPNFLRGSVRTAVHYDPQKFLEHCESKRVFGKDAFDEIELFVDQVRNPRLF